MKNRFKLSVAFSATLLLFSSLAFLFIPGICEGSVISDLCAGVIGVLGDEEKKAGEAVKSCKKNCRWTNRKHEILRSAHKKAKDSCARGEAPDTKEADIALGGNAKARLKSLYERNGRMFDGKAKLQNTDFAPEPSRQAAVLNGKGGQVADLKSSEPDYKKIGLATEFNLKGGFGASAASSAAPADTAGPAQKTRTDSPSAAPPQVPVFPDISRYLDSIGKMEADLRAKYRDASKKELCDAWSESMAAMEGDLAKAKAETNAASCESSESATAAACVNARYQALVALTQCDTALSTVRKKHKDYCTGLSWFDGSWFNNNVKKPWNVASGMIKDQITGAANWLKDRADDLVLKADELLYGKGRGLNPDELAMAKEIFGECTKEICSINYANIRIVTGDDLTLWDKLITINLKKKGEGKQVGDRIIFPNDKDGNSTYDPNEDTDVLMHELTHVYQDNTYGWASTSFKDQWQNWTLGDDRYKYDASDTNKPFNTFTLEGQAEIVKEYAYISWWIQQGGKLSNLDKERQDNYENIKKILDHADLLKK